MEETFELLFESAKLLGLKPRRESSYGLLSIQPRAKRYFLFYGTSPLNNQLASYLASNKHATRLLLEQHDLPNIPYILPVGRSELTIFFRQHGKIIGKPTRGRQSKGVRLITTQSRLDRIGYEDMIFEKYIEGTELRVLVLDDNVLAVHRRNFPGPINNPVKVVRSALAVDGHTELSKIAVSAMRAVGLRFGTVDFIVANQPYILEINSAPGLFFFKHPHAGTGIDIGRIYLEATVAQLEPNWKSPL
jgi:glutathione synthase/RimK-type ligase-like ATP-grasp enzyme